MIGLVNRLGRSHVLRTLTDRAVAVSRRGAGTRRLTRQQQFHNFVLKRSRVSLFAALIQIKMVRLELKVLTLGIVVIPHHLESLLLKATLKQVGIELYCL